MKHKILFHLDDGWALGADSLQWLLLRARKRHAETVWQAQAYVRSSKSILFCCMREKGVEPTAEAQKKLDTLPVRFSEWQARHQIDPLRSRNSAKRIKS